MKIMGRFKWLCGRLKKLAFRRPLVPVCYLTTFVFLFVLLVDSVKFSECLKTMNSVRSTKLVLADQHHNHHKLWSPKGSVQACHTPGSGKLGQKCKKPGKSLKAKFLSDKRKDKGLITTGASYPQVPESLQDLRTLTPENIQQINKYVRQKRHYCKLHRFESFTCRKLKLSLWLAKQLERNVTRLTSWMEIVRSDELGASEMNNGSRGASQGRTSQMDLASVRPTNWPEKIAFRLIKAWGDPEDLFVFYKYKDFANSRELKIELPYQAQLKVSPKTDQELEEQARGKLTNGLSELSQETQRFFWDPGFNLKLKLPFFRDELSK